MSSTLVETVSINYEDFSDSFLTCGTCLCMYNNEERSPKLLSCSHTVCQSCLEHIIEAQGRNTTTFRCPICRETITIPRGGVISFPPSFIVNQLLDLMGRQRRDVIPKCAQHSQTELMFCESCDVVFCVDCTGGSHNGGGASAHTIIPFSIAIKRMSEILLYKASLCMKNLDGAIDVVSDEINKLDESAERCIETIVKVFQDVTSIVEQRKLEVVQMVKKIRDEKKRVLKEQLDIVESEKRRVQADCQGLQHQVEVRNITAKIGDLNEKLDISATLTEPRENAFMQFEYRHNTAMADIFNALSRFGKIAISKTFPALCKASEIKTATIHLKTTVTVTTVDYHGNARTTGGDPVVARMHSINGGDEVPIDLTDCDNGSYTLTFTPLMTGQHRISISIFDRPIKDGPFVVDVTNHINPILKVGSPGSGSTNFKQPVSIGFCDNHIYVLDTGNSRVKVLDENLRLEQLITGHGLEQHSTTGMALANNGNLILINWRTKLVTERTLEGTIVKQFTSPEFVEPISVAVNSHNEIIVADNGVGKLFVFNETGSLLHVIGSKGNRPGQFKLISSVYATPGDDLIVCDHRLQMFSRSGQYIGELSASSTGKGGTYGGVCVDKHGSYLATRSEKGRCIVQVFTASRQWLFDVDSCDDRLKRPSGIVTNCDGHVYVVDLGNDCIKKFRYI